MPKSRIFLLREINRRISQSLNLQDIFDIACLEIRDFNHVDRVAIFKFFPKSNYQQGEFIAESVADPFDSIIAQSVNDHCFGETYSSHYSQDQYWSCDDIDDSDLPASHIAILSRFQVRANLVIPLMQQGDLWGLLCLHQCSKTRHWETREIDLTLQLAHQLEIAIRQSHLFEQLQTELDERKQAEQTIRRQINRERLLRTSIQRVSQSLDLQEIFDTACTEVRQFIQADRVAIFQFDQASGYDDGLFVAESVVAGFDSVLAKRVQDHSFGDSYAALYFKGQYLAIDDIYNPMLSRCHVDILEQFQIRANLVIPVTLKEMLWGLLCIHQCSSARRWEGDEVNLVQQLASQLAIAIQQADLYKQLQADLVIRKRAERQLQQQADQERLLTSITQRVRSSLNLEAILDATVKEVQQVLQSDRVLIYRVFADSTGVAIAEAVLPEWPAILNRTFPTEVFPPETRDAYGKGRIGAVSDREDETQVSFPCLVDFLDELRVRAKLVIPIIQQQTLWGLLIAHQCDHPRLWQPWEIALLQKISDQLAIAIQQASLVEQLQQQLTQREQAQKLLTQRNEQLAISNIELARATRLKDEFLANMSHELRTPLNAILGMTEILAEQVYGELNQHQLKSLNTIERSGNHLLELINDILDLAKVEAGTLELELAPTQVIPLCKSSLAFVKQMAYQKKIQLKEKITDPIPDLMLDERRIRQVLINLLNNAVKFTLEGGCITLTVSFEALPVETEVADVLPAHRLKFAVQDTGIGIEKRQLDRLFQPFSQVDSALNRQYTGTGLGLALVKRIAELHGGAVSVTSEIGVGSCFTVELPGTMVTSPLSLASAASDSDGRLTPEPPQAVGPLILLAEDNTDNIELIYSYLGAKGYQVLVAKNGLEAIAMAQAHAPDVILMDIQMPGMDGLEAIGQIRQDANLSDVSIIALTALAMKGDRERCLAAGADDYLTKPVKMKQLVTTIQTLLDAKEEF